MERETGIEPATNSLEGCDSTTELLPPFDSLRRSPLDAALRLATSNLLAACRQRNSANLLLPARQPSHAYPAREGWWGGEGSNLRSPKAADLQSAAIDHSATSPKYISC